MNARSRITSRHVAWTFQFGLLCFLALFAFACLGGCAYDRELVVGASRDFHGADAGKAFVEYRLTRRPAPSLYVPHAEAPAR